MKKLFIFPFILFISCEMTLEPQTVGLEQFESKDCTEERDKSERSIASLGDSISAYCKDLSLYKCDKRVFSPTAEDNNLIDQVYSLDGLSLTYNLYSFNTNKVREEDPNVPDEMFEAGEDYNKTEVQCYMPGEKGRGIYGNGSTLNEAIMGVIAACDKKESES